MSTRVASFFVVFEALGGLCRAVQPLSLARRWSAWGTIALCSLSVWSCGGSAVGAPEARQLPSSVRRVEVPTVAVERDALAGIRSLRSDRVEVAVAFPDALDPEREHPILITQVTADSSRPNVAALAEYAPAALAQGYVVLTAQGIPWPEREEKDTLLHRYASVRAGLRWLASEVPQSERWPVVIAGFSGGAKISQVLAFSLMLEQRRVAGVFLGGCNEDHSRLLLGQYPALEERFAQVAFFLSVGADDRIAPPEAARSVAAQLRGSGAERVELSVHPGEHRLDVRDLSRALRWFRTQIEAGG